MRYVLLGDIHSSEHDLRAVLRHAEEVAPDATYVGTGDLYECTVSKKQLPLAEPLPFHDVLLWTESFESLVTFPSVYGNQEERILLVSAGGGAVRERIEQLPEVIALNEEASVIHGHQWEWGGSPWSLQRADAPASVTFYGHSHTSMLIVDGVRKPVVFGKAYEIVPDLLVNVGSVVANREWVLYDAAKRTVTFQKV